MSHGGPPKLAMTLDEFRRWLHGDRLDLILRVGAWLDRGDDGGGVFDTRKARRDRGTRFLQHFYNYGAVTPLPPAPPGERPSRGWCEHGRARDWPCSYCDAFTMEDAERYILEFFGGDLAKATEWWTTECPLLGHVPPVDLVSSGPENREEVFRFIRTAKFEAELSRRRAREDKQP